MPQRETADHRRARSTDDTVEAEVDVAATPQDSALDAEVDAILDEIDDVLEVNAEDFVKSFVQKGGQ
jgi:ubiquitin-like protein Pup